MLAYLGQASQGHKTVDRPPDTGLGGLGRPPITSVYIAVAISLRVVPKLRHLSAKIMPVLLPNIEAPHAFGRCGTNTAFTHSAMQPRWLRKPLIVSA